MTPVRRAADRWCPAQGRAPLAEASPPDGRFVIIEAKSVARDFTTDSKWPCCRAWCDALHFAVDPYFPQALPPPSTGWIVTDGPDAGTLRAAPDHPPPAARRHSPLLRLGMASARHLAALGDPAGSAALCGAPRAG